MGTRAVVRSGIGGLVFGGVLYLAGDTGSDLYTYSKLQGQAMELVRQDPLVASMVGQPYTTGAWYDSTLAFSHRDKVAHCTFQLKGSRGVTDIAVKAGRRPGYKSNILYNFIGPGVWQLVSCQAMEPYEGGLVKPRSLMPEHKQQQQQQAAAAAGDASCQPCQVQQQQQQQKHGQSRRQLQQVQDQTAAAGSSQRRWWWWRKQKDEQHQQQQPQVNQAS